MRKKTVTGRISGRCDSGRSLASLAACADRSAHRPGKLLYDGQRVHARRLVSAKPPCDRVSRESVRTDLDPAPDSILPLLDPEAPVSADVGAPVLVGLAGAGVQVQGVPYISPVTHVST